MLVSKRSENLLFDLEKMTNELGKTILVSRIIDHLRFRAAKSPLLFFYFKHRDEVKRSIAGMLRAFLVQLLYQDDTLIDRIYQSCCSTGTSELRSPSVLKSLTQECLKTQRQCLIVLDGLDECGDGQNARQEEANDIIQWFQNSLMPNCNSEGCCIRLLLVGQRDGVIDQCLSTYPSIKLDTIGAHARDIHEYAVSRSSEIRKRFSLSYDIQSEIVNKVTKASKGECGSFDILLDLRFI